jgi:hypothetical protein
MGDVVVIRGFTVSKFTYVFLRAGLIANLSRLSPPASKADVTLHQLEHHMADLPFLLTKIPLLHTLSRQHPRTHSTTLRHFGRMSVGKASLKRAEDFVEFLNASPTPFHAVHTAKQRLEKAGFKQIKV